MLSMPSAKLAPGPFNPFTPGRFSHPYGLLEKSRRYGPVFKFSWERNLSTAIVGFEAAREFLTAHDAHLSGISQDLSLLGDVKHVRNLQGDVHTACKRHLVQAMPKIGTEAHAGDLRAFLGRELDEYARQCVKGAPSAEDFKQALRVIGTGLLIISLFGCRPSSDAFEALLKGFLQIGPNGLVWNLGKDQVRAYRALEDTVTDLIAGLSQEDLNHDDARYLKAFSQAAKSDRLVLINLLAMFEMGRYDLAAFLRWIVCLLGRNPTVIDDLVQARAQGEKHLHDLTRACVFECLRHVQSESLARRADADIVFQGHFIPKGSFVRICLWETHKDPSAFPDPFHFDPARFLHKSHDANVFAPFGLDKHKCVAADTVVRLAGLFIEELVKGFTWEPMGDNEPVRPFSLWEPSSEFTVALRRGAKTEPKEL